LLASPDQIIAVAHNTIQETGDLTNHAEMVLLHGMGRELPEMDERAPEPLSAAGNQFGHAFNQSTM